MLPARDAEMKRLFVIACFLAMPLSYAADRDPHLAEKGCGAIQTHSSFAHGYRHGYEEGFHYGNLDVNMARTQRTKWGEFKELRSRYSSEFGSRTSFDKGFKAGALAGYADGYRGTGFRVLEELRRIGTQQFAASPDFDGGMAAGYRDGLGLGSPKDPNRASRRSCSLRAGSSADKDSFCDGYHRGYELGRSDRIALSGSPAILEASR